MKPYDYAERVYAGVLGKIIGVYLGRPVEGWSFESITQRFGEIDRYVHTDMGVDLVVADDDISGTFTFLRALPDNGNDPHISPGQVGDTWLNYIIENRTVLWWGGMGVSTEHTAYLRLKHGIAAPASGSIALNSQVVAEQIGAQIFIDGCGLICPGDPERAAGFAARAARVSHDGEAVYAAQVVAAMAAQAFVEPSVDKLIDLAAGLIPRDCLIARLIADIRAWHAESPDDWRATRAQIAPRYGYDRYGGGCHVVPNHALVIHALLHGKGDFSRSLAIVNTCGWDTDCNSANVGCILGVRGGLNGMSGAYDWRGPVADRLFLPSADGGRCVTDAVQEAVRIANIGLAVAGEPVFAPKGNARFSFAFPGSVQGFCSGEAALTNEALPDDRGNGLRIGRRLAGAGDAPIRVWTPTFLSPDETSRPGYGMAASPTLYPGQVLEATVMLNDSASEDSVLRPFIQHFGSGSELTLLPGPLTAVQPGAVKTVTWRIPSTGGQPIARVGLEIIDPAGRRGKLFIDSVTWSGGPTCELIASQGDAWGRAWVNAASAIEFAADRSGFRITQNEGTGLVIQGTREWTDYTVTAKITAHMCDRFGLAARVQGLRRYYALVLTRGNKAQLIRAMNGEEALAEEDFEWGFDRTYEFSLCVRSGHIAASIDNRLALEVDDDSLDGGAVAIVCTEGTAYVNSVDIAASNGTATHETVPRLHRNGKD